MTRDDDFLDDEEAPDGVALESAAEVTCPYCGEAVEITLDPGNGESQDYVEDCQVCCRPWRVQVRYDETGAAEVWLEAES